MNRVIFEFCAEDRARLDRLAALLEKVQTHFSVVTTDADGVKYVKDGTVSIEKAAAALANSAAAPQTVEPERPEETPPFEVDTPTPEPEQPERAYTHAEVQAVVVRLASPKGGKRAEVRAIVTAYAKSVSQIPEDKLGEVMEKLTALEQEGKA